MAQDPNLGDNWNEELEQEAGTDVKGLVVFSRDWTVETIVSQIDKGNIDLNPKFQRRNAWTDDRRSKLIESLLLGLPVPEIVLAEDKRRKNSFIVIDGKQRLLAIAGFLDPNRQTWAVPKLKGLRSRSDLNGKSFQDFFVAGAETQDARDLLNSDIRCTVISNYASSRVLYDIFYRLNTGSVPLSSQELRQVLNAGDFADYLIESTNTLIPLHEVLRLKEPDTRLRDAEIVLRHIALHLFGQKYDGNLMPFLDESMAIINANWETYRLEVDSLFSSFNAATRFLLETFPDKKVGRKYTEGEWESRFNRAVFEVQAFYFSCLGDEALAAIEKPKVVDAFKVLCESDSRFQESIEVSTKTLQNYEQRFTRFSNSMNAALKLNVEAVPVTVL
jgi:hypothetical protein